MGLYDEIYCDAELPDVDVLPGAGGVAFFKPGRFTTRASRSTGSPTLAD
jgi:hypothetical protein